MEPGQAEMRLPPLASARTSGRAGVLERLRGMSVRHPEWWMLALSAAAWAFLAATPHAPPDGGGAPGRPAHTAGLAAMVVAMMLPLTAGQVRELARSNSVRPRWWAFARFLAGYLAIWMLAMFAIDAAWRLTVSAADWGTAVGAAIAAAVLWEVAPAKWRRWHRHGREAMPVITHGKREHIDAIPSGVTAGSSCVGSCWTLMAICVAFAHSLPVMAVIFIIQLYDRYRRPAFPALAAMAVLGVCLVSLVLTMSGHPPHPGH
jgi:predicted metal-binding membrane protein